MAFEEAPPGFALCVSPTVGSGTNALYKNLLSDLHDLKYRMSILELYMHALHTSIDMCAADLPMFILYILDYHLRRIIRDMKKNDGNMQRFQHLLVGKQKSRPFKGLHGNQIRYTYLLSSLQHLTEKVEEQSDSSNSENTHEKVNLFDNLLLSAEECLVYTIRHCGLTAPTAGEIREDCKKYIDSAQKRKRDTSAHLFSDLFYQQQRTPLERLWLEDEIFPPENYSLFPENSTVMSTDNLRKLGLKIIALADLERRMQVPPCTTDPLEPAAPLISDLAVQLAKQFIKMKGHFEHSMEFRYGPMAATIDIDPSKPVQVIDLGPVKGTASSQ